MDREVLVYADLQGKPYLVGRLWARLRKDRETATFEYHKSWLAHSERFSLEPALKLGPGPCHTAADKPLFGAIGDSAPDRWRRVLGRLARGSPIAPSATNPEQMGKCPAAISVPLSLAFAMEQFETHPSRGASCSCSRSPLCD